MGVGRWAAARWSITEPVDRGRSLQHTSTSTVNGSRDLKDDDGEVTAYHSRLTAQH